MTFNLKNAITIIVVSMNINKLPLIMLICLSSTIVIELIMSLLIGLLGGVGLTVLAILLIVFINNKVKSRKN